MNAKAAKQTAAELVLRTGYLETTYLNALKVDRAFRAEVGSIRSFVQSAQSSSEASVELTAWFLRLGGKVGDAQGLSVEFQVDDPYVMALLLYGALAKADRLVDPCVGNDPGAFYYLGGPSRLHHPELTPQVDQAGQQRNRDVVERERSRQEILLRWRDDSVRAVSMLFTGPCPVALVMDVQWLDGNSMSSYPSGTYGILGRHESVIEGVHFLAPMFVWWQGPSA